MIPEFVRDTCFQMKLAPEFPKMKKTLRGLQKNNQKNTSPKIIVIITNISYGKNFIRS